MPLDAAVLQRWHAAAEPAVVAVSFSELHDPADAPRLTLAEVAAFVRDGKPVPGQFPKLLRRT